MAVRKEAFGATKKGEQVSIFHMENKNGMKAAVSDFGAVLVSLLVPDAEGKQRDVVLGFDTVEGYENNGPGFGATVGRNGNRIGKGRFQLNGKTIQLKINDNSNNLHSGGESYHFRMWEGQTEEKDTEQSVIFSLVSPDQDQGFPGNFKITVTYTLTDENELRITYDGVPDQDTIINMTNHSYFNLDGHETNSVLEQFVWLAADKFTETDEELIPTGNLADVSGSAMDFRTEKQIGLEIENDETALKYAGGYDHNWVLCNQGTYRKVGSMRSEESGILMDIFTDLPGIQFYTANFLDETLEGKEDIKYGRRAGACFETQYYPDAPNHSNFPSTVVRAGEKYHTVTSYQFTTKKNLP